MAGEGEKKPVLEMVQADGADDGCVTFVMHDEDHTLGNSLRYMIMKNPEVEFCGYTITHPSESKINFRIQTRGQLQSVPELHASSRLHSQAKVLEEAFLQWSRCDAASTTCMTFANMSSTPSRREWLSLKKVRSNLWNKHRNGNHKDSTSPNSFVLQKCGEVFMS
ncbi:DNA-directed RNA polymerases I and III subunit RPAC2 isoform X1 [Poeciliopsis prolifica]|uniref:DNA-directed RNA polymerases I and III subunit RPAC2 isoform X1 n=1 Tax=Poeciliopsis prolifica TaxID=188132 RepID=UPI0024136800|nr:DNA-directed RNA polymerases I and III subunit RPAC2 isoform X1 [Poeciliopsis prolifica]